MDPDLIVDPPSALFLVIEKFFIECGLKRVARCLRKETNTKPGVRRNTLKLMDIYNAYLKAGGVPAGTKRKRAERVVEAEAKKKKKKEKRERRAKENEEKLAKSTEEKEVKKEEKDQGKAGKDNEGAAKEKKEKKENKKRKKKKAKTGDGSNGSQALPEEPKALQQEQQVKEEAPSAKPEQNGAAAYSVPRPFKRVREDEVTVDPRLADNSYAALRARGHAWGDKANDVLGNVRGKGFRHEKTKKKRGSYRGGSINVDQVNSTKFDS